MTTPDRSADRSAREPLRLRLVPPSGRGRLDGGWWPQSRDPAIELADLVDHFPAERGRVVRALLWPPDWESSPGRVAVAAGHVEVGSCSPDDSHMIELRTSQGTVLRVLVVPADLSDDQGAEALLAASTPGNDHEADDLLAVVTEHPDVDPADHWSDAGGAWWDESGPAPSFRTPLRN